MFKENRNIRFNINPKKFFSWNDSIRREVHNDNETTTKWNAERKATAEAGFLNPISSITNGIRNAVKDTLSGIKNFGKRTVQLGTTAILGTIALPFNLLKWTWDNSVQLVGSGSVVGATKGGELITWPSRVARSTQNKINNALGLENINK